MSDWQQVFEPMERTLGRMLDQTDGPVLDNLVTEPALSGAVPLLEEVLAPVSRVLSRADEHARAADMHLEDALAALTTLRDGMRGFPSE